MDNQTMLTEMLVQLDDMYDKLFDMGETTLGNQALCLSEAIANVINSSEQDTAIPFFLVSDIA